MAPLSPKLFHGARQFLDGGADVLHGQVGQAGETVGVFLGELGDVVVALAVHGQGLVGVQIVEVHVGVAGQDVHVHAEGLHIGDALFGASRKYAGCSGAGCRAWGR